MGEGLATSWNIEEGRGRLRAALHRLDLAGEKRRVKQELKRYDAEFRKQFLRLPTHTEKEPMRPLYVYYRRLKLMITQAENNKRRNEGDDEATGQIGARRDSLTTIADV